VSSGSEGDKGIDRIKRSILKNDIAEGGLNITDVECLNSSLKLRQFIRANKSRHPIKTIQGYCMEKLGYNSEIQQEYDKIMKKEEVTRIAQIAINNLCDFTRSSITNNLDKYINDINAVNFITATRINTYLLRQNKKLVHCVYIPLRNEGIEFLQEICQEEETERDREKLKRIRMVIVTIQSEMVELASTYNENVNNDSVGLKHIIIKGEGWMETSKISTKELQRTLKVAKRKVSVQDFNIKLGTKDYRKENISKFRYQCKNVKLRHIYFRLTTKDFFTMEKMFKYKMVDNNKCKRCGEVETYKHLLWECREAKNIWHLYNEFVTNLNQNNERIQEYDNVFMAGNKGYVSKVKMKIVQEMIQIDRPRCWTIERIKEIANEINSIELYNKKIKYNMK
jgi:hypothetical protein